MEAPGVRPPISQSPNLFGFDPLDPLDPLDPRSIS
jgi:hypothetical protein